MSNRFKVGILTFHNANNYGAVLQCYALQSYLIKMENVDAQIINYTPIKFKKVFYDTMKPLSAYGFKNKIRALGKYFLKHSEMKNESQKKKKIDKFINQYLILTEEVSDFSKLDFDYYIVGSDQVWNLELIENDTKYLLDFVENKKKISYAASFKIGDVDNFALDMYKKNLKSFDYISVREDNLVDYLKENVGISSNSVLDPTFLMDNWDDFISDRLIKDKYLLIYYVNMPKKLIDEAIQYSKNNNLKIVSLNKIDSNIEYVNYSNASIEDFLNLIYYSTMVFTTSFHGMAISIQMKKEFCFEVPFNSYNNNERLLDLARKTNLLSRNILDNQYDCNKRIEWKNVEELLEFYKNESKKFIKDVFVSD